MFMFSWCGLLKRRVTVTWVDAFGVDGGVKVTDALDVDVSVAH